MTYFNKGLCLESIDNYNEAIICYDNAIKLDRNKDIYYYQRAKYFYHIKKCMKALSDIEEAIKIRENDLNKKFKSNNESEKIFDIYQKLRNDCLKELERSHVSSSSSNLFYPSSLNHSKNEGKFFSKKDKSNSSSINSNEINFNELNINNSLYENYEENNWDHNRNCEFLELFPEQYN